ncbi:MAG: nucleotide exchange factor GrpE [Marinilabiliales bacterium]|nr:MAG: nucleotide exchange factor GrpE [Marinilabiliales bacterium]
MTTKKTEKKEGKDKKTTQQSKKQSSKAKSTKQEKKNEEVKESEKEVENKKEKSDKEKFEEINDKYLRLAAEYDNYRKRTLKERMELTKTAGEDILVNILPVIDDFERALGSIDQATEIDAVKEGVQLIYSKFKEFLKQRGVKEIEAKEKDFDTDLHEAITKIPAPDEKLKGKVVDVVEKGYYLHEKVIRFSKVVIGE